MSWRSYGSIIALFSLVFGAYSLWLHQMSFPGGIIISEIAISIFFLFLSFTVISRIHNFYHSKSALNSVHIGIISFFALLVTGAHYGIVLNVFQQPDFLEWTRSSFILHLILFFLLILVISNHFWMEKHSIEQEKMTEALVKKERELVQSELSNIQEQFKPHFLFNSLNSISSLTLFEPEKAREMIQQLSDYLRASVNRKSDETIPLEEELNYLKLYLAIEKIRFEERLNIHFHVEENLDQFKVPALILQPIIENAIKYGLYGTTQAVEITIRIEKNNNELVIKVENPFDEDAILTSKGKGFGLVSIKQRLYFIYSRNDLLRTSKSPSHYLTTLVLPQL